MKRIMCVLVAVILVFVMLEAPHAFADADELPIIPAPRCQKKVAGDADGDMEITYMDALLVLRHSIGLAQLNSEAVKLCDVDDSGNLTYMDALLILRKSIGLFDEF